MKLIYFSIKALVHLMYGTAVKPKNIKYEHNMYFKVLNQK